MKAHEYIERHWQIDKAQRLAYAELGLNVRDDRGGVYLFHDLSKNPYDVDHWPPGWLAARQMQARAEQLRLL